jgi:hypothetical protein
LPTGTTRLPRRQRQTTSPISATRSPSRAVVKRPAGVLPAGALPGKEREHHSNDPPTKVTANPET